MKFVKNVLVILIGISCVVLWAVSPAFSEVSNYDLEQRIKELEKRLGEEKKAEKPGILEKWSDKVTLSGAIELVGQISQLHQ